MGHRRGRPPSRARSRGPHARLRRRELRDYILRCDFLSLLNLGNGTAIGTRWGVVYEGRAAMWLKDRIDRGFTERYR